MSTWIITKTSSCSSTLTQFLCVSDRVIFLEANLSVSSLPQSPSRAFHSSRGEIPDTSWTTQRPRGSAVWVWPPPSPALLSVPQCLRNHQYVCKCILSSFFNPRFSYMPPAHIQGGRTGNWESISWQNHTHPLALTCHMQMPDQCIYLNNKPPVATPSTSFLHPPGSSKRLTQMTEWVFQPYGTVEGHPDNTQK